MFLVCQASGLIVTFDSPRGDILSAVSGALCALLALSNLRKNRPCQYYIGMSAHDILSNQKTSQTESLSVLCAFVLSLS